MKADFLRYNIENLLSFLFENKINEKIKNNQHSPLDSANKKVYNIAKNKGREPKEVRK